MTMLYDAKEFSSLSDMVYHHLYEAITDGRYHSGDLLIEMKIAEELGVSRTPVREAIRKLELEGLVLMIPRKGAEVAEITIKDLEDVLEVRAALEELAVCDACENITEEQILALKEAADNFQAALESDDLVKCAETDMAFHEIIYSATNNKRLLQILNNLREQMYRYRMEYLKEPGTHKLLLKEHEAIYSALKKHDKAEAGSAIRIHIENQRRSIISSLRDAGRITEQV